MFVPVFFDWLLNAQANWHKPEIAGSFSADFRLLLYPRHQDDYLQLFSFSGINLLNFTITIAF